MIPGDTQDKADSLAIGVTRCRWEETRRIGQRKCDEVDGMKCGGYLQRLDRLRNREGMVFEERVD